MPRPISLPEPWRSLCEEVERRWRIAHPGQRSPGGVTLVARALGADRRTIARWARGERRPGGTARLAIAALFARHNLEPPPCAR